MNLKEFFWPTRNKLLLFAIFIVIMSIAIAFSGAATGWSSAADYILPLFIPVSYAAHCLIGPVSFVLNFVYLYVIVCILAVIYEKIRLGRGV